MNNINEGQTYVDKINLQKEIEAFLSYLVENSSTENIPEIKFIDNDIDNASTIFGKTAFYDPNDNSITLYTEGRHPSDLLKSLAHEYLHHIQNQEGRLQNITTDNIEEDDNLKELEREAYEYSGLMFRKYKDSKKNKKLQKEYKEYVLTELFEKDLPNIKKISSTQYIVGNGNDIEAKYFFIRKDDTFKNWSINWSFTNNNSNTTQEAWKQVTATSYKILQDFINNKNPFSISISGNGNMDANQKNNIYKSESYLEKLTNLLNNKYRVDNSDEDMVVLNLIESKCKEGIIKRMDIMNESYEQALNYWQNGDLNAKGGGDRWSAIQHKVKREVLQEVYQIDENYNIPINCNPKPKSNNDLYEHLTHIVGEIKLNPSNSVDKEGGLLEGYFQVGDIKYKYKIYEIDNLYNDGKSFYNIYFHPENQPISESLNNTSKENYIRILNTMYKIILDFINKEKPNYIGISSFDNDFSRNYHTVYNNLSRHNGIPGYIRKNSNLEFETDKGEKGRFIVFKRVENFSDGKDPYGLNQYARELIKELFSEEEQKYQIYVDMDEVLVAFDDGFKEKFGEAPSTYEKKYGMNDLVDKINQQDIDFWNNLKWTFNGKPLWNYIKKYNPIIITAPSGKNSEIGKRRWVNYNLGAQVPIIFAQADEKAKYSGKNKILVDDLSSTIYNWIDKGGIGIHYISAFDTVNKLKELGI